MTPTEEWRPIEGYEGLYEVSNQGRVRSLTRVIPGVRTINGRVLSPTVGHNGYPQVTLRRRALMVHALVAAAFLGDRPTGYEVCHNDGNPQNNRVDNLRYDTVSANRRDTIKHGNHWQVLKTHCPQGHPYSEENTGRHRGARRCLTCHRERERARYERGHHAQAI